MDIYLPYKDRTPDFQYRGALRRILEEGIYTRNEYQDKGTFTVATLPNMVFPISNGVPLITERAIPFWRRAVNEAFAFIGGARTLDELLQYGDKKTSPSWWKRWVTAKKCALFGLKPGDMGPGSYGAGYHHDEFNQWEHLVRQIRERPWLRTHRVTPWVPKYCLQHDGLQRQVVVAPCHGDIQVSILEDRMFFRMDQRSCDMTVGGPANMIQWPAVFLALAQVTGYKPHTFIHSIHDGQIYEDQLTHARQLVRRRPRPFPTLRIIDPTIDDLSAFRAEHFEITDYYPHDPMDDIPVTE